MIEFNVCVYNLLPVCVCMCVWVVVWGFDFALSLSLSPALIEAFSAPAQSCC